MRNSEHMLWWYGKKIKEKQKKSRNSELGTKKKKHSVLGKNKQKDVRNSEQMLWWYGLKHLVNGGRKNNSVEKKLLPRIAIQKTPMTFVCVCVCVCVCVWVCVCRARELTLFNGQLISNVESRVPGAWFSL